MPLEAKEMREAGVCQQVTSGTVDSDGQFLVVTDVGQIDQLLPYTELLGYLASNTGAVLEVAADGLRLSASALGDGLTGGGASVVSVDIAGLAEETSLMSTDEFMVQTAGGLKRISKANVFTANPGVTNLASSPGVSSVVVSSSTGTDATIAAATVSLAGVMTASDKAKLDTIASEANAYTHPNHSGDVTSTGDGATVIAANAVTYAKMQDVTASRLIGRGAGSGDGDPQSISLGASLQFSGTTLQVNPSGISTSGLTNDAGWNAYVHPNHTGDVTSVADGAQTIAANVVTNAKLVDMAQDRIKGRVSAGSGDPEDLTAAQVRTMINVANGANAYVHPNHSGDVTSVADGATTIAADAVSNAKLSNMAQNTIKGRVTASTGDPEDLTATQVRTIINVADGANLYVHPNHSGDVTSVADGATTIAADAVTNAKLANVSPNTLKGRITASIGDPEDLTAAQARTLLNVADGANAYVHPNHSGDVVSVADGATTIQTGSVTNAKLADMAQWTIKGRATGSTGDPEDLAVGDLTEGTPASGSMMVGYLATGELRKFDVGNWPAGGGGGDITGGINVGTNGTGVYDGESAGVLNFRNIAPGSSKITVTFDAVENDIDLDVVPGNILTSTLNNDAGWNNYVHPSHSGDVTGSGALTIAAGAVTNLKMADMNANSIKGNASASVADPADLTSFEITEDTSPQLGKYVLGWDDSNRLRKFDIGRIRSNDYTITVRGSGTPATDQAAVAAAVTQLNSWGKGTLELEGNVTITGSHSFTAPISLKMRGRYSLLNVQNDVLSGFSWNANWKPTTATNYVAGSVLAGDDFIDSPNLTVNPGEWFIVWSNDNLTGVNPHFTNHHPMEMHRCLGMDGNDIFFDDFAWDAMSTSVKIVKVPTLSDVRIEGLKVKWTGGAQSDYTQFLNCRGLTNFVIEDLWFDVAGPGAIAMNYCGGGVIQGLQIEGQKNDNGVYGVVFSVVNDCKLLDSTIKGTRHPFTTSYGESSDPDTWGTCRNALISNVTARSNGYFSGGAAVDGSKVMFDTHPTVGNVTFEGCHAIVPGRAATVAHVGFQSRASGTTFKDCKVTSPRTGATGTGYRAYGEKVRFENCSQRGGWHGIWTYNHDEIEIHGGDLSEISAEAIKVNSGDNCTIKDVKITDCGFINGTTAPISIAGGVGHKVYGCSVPKGSNGYSININAVVPTNIEIANNILTGYGSNTIGLKADSDQAISNDIYHDANIVAVRSNLLNHGNVSGSYAINFSTTQAIHEFTLIGNTTPTVTDPLQVGEIWLIIRQDATGGRTWSWSNFTINGSEPSITTLGSTSIAIKLFWDGAEYHTFN